jgi:hypothetical protein
MQTMAGSRITGRVTFEGPDVPAPQDIGLTPVPANLDFAPFVGVANHAEVHDDWSFEIVNVSGPRRLRVLAAPSGWSLKAVLLNGRDVTDDVLALGLPAQSLKDVEVVMTRQAPRISGRVIDDRGNGAGGRAVVAFAVDADKRDGDSRFFGVARSGRDGSFDLAGLPPGDYFVTSDRMRDADDWHDPELLDALARSAQRVTLVEGQTLSLAVTVSR